MVCDEKAIDLIHENSLRLLSGIGMAFQAESALDTLRAGGVEVRGNRAFFTEKQVMDAVNAAKKAFTVYARNPAYNVRVNTEELYVMPGYGSPSICEPDGTLRPSGFDDFLKLATIVQQSDVFSINGGILAQPNDIEATIAAEAMVYATLKMSDKALFSVCGGRLQAERIMELMKIVFGGSIQELPCSFNLISTLSPMALARNAIETMEVCARNGQPLVLAPGPMAGGTGPVSLAGNVSLCNAEILGANVYAQLIRPETPIIYGFAATVSNMRDMSCSNACPGFVKESRFGALLAKKYGFACRSGGGMSDAGGLTAQAGVESAMSLFESFSMKANFIMHAAGSMSSFNSVSFEKLILDIETIGRMRYYFSELPVDEEALGFDAIREAVEGDGTFMLLEHTLDRCRKDPWQAEVSQHGRCKGDPNQELYGSIRRKLDELLGSYRRPPMDAAVEGALDAYMLSIGMKQTDMAKCDILM